MRARVFTGCLLAATLGIAGAALAQPGLSTKPNYDLIYKSDLIDDEARREVTFLHQSAVQALQAQDYAAAEKNLSDLLKIKSAPPASNFLMGLAKIGLEKWDEAQLFLETAVATEPKRPEPKTRLGITYAKLNNTDAARQQRAALAGLDVDCRQTCADAQWINEGLVLLDQALASEEAARRVSAAALAAIAPAPADGAKGFDPEKYSLVEFTDTNQLYDLLTQPGRCPANKTAEARQPCALILYRPTDGATETLAANFKPVFKIISRKSIWAIHDKKLQKIRIEDLYFDNVDVVGAKPAAYISVALIGNAENKANCESGKPCLGQLVAEDMFRMYGNMPPSVVEVIWGAAGMKDPGTQRVR